MDENLYTKDCIRTYSGVYFNVFNPTLDMIRVEDIAHSLSQQCRFGGHIKQFYSVARHSINCCYLIEDENLKLTALLHDASEAYLLDMPSPIKQNLFEYKQIEDNLNKLICEKFGLKFPFDEQIKKIDNIMLENEWGTLMLGKYNPVFKPHTIVEDKKDFLKLFGFYSR